MYNQIHPSSSSSLSSLPNPPFLNLTSSKPLFSLKTRPFHFQSSKLCLAIGSGRVRSRSKKMADEDKDAFYLVRKGEMIGIYKTLRDCQAQAGSTVSDPSITVYKGYGMSKEAEEFLCSHGLKNPSYSITVDDAKDNLYGKFGALIPCPFQEPSSFGVEEKSNDGDDDDDETWQEAIELLEMAEKKSFSSLPTAPQKKVVKPDINATPVGTVIVSSSREDGAVSASLPTIPRNKFLEFDGSMNSIGTPTIASACDTCLLEFDGASKGNPGLSGAGALLRATDRSVVWRLREGVGLATNNVAEYRALLLGLRCALRKGFKHIRAQGDSKLVVMQVQGQWQTRNRNMADLCTKARELKEKFVSFQITHVLREFNSEADAQANRALTLKDGQVEEDCQQM